MRAIMGIGAYKKSLPNSLRVIRLRLFVHVALWEEIRNVRSLAFSVEVHK